VLVADPPAPDDVLEPAPPATDVAEATFELRESMDAPALERLLRMDEAVSLAPEASDDALAPIPPAPPPKMVVDPTVMVAVVDSPVETLSMAEVVTAELESDCCMLAMLLSCEMENLLLSHQLQHHQQRRLW
jgi:hypothetical protein